MVAVRVRCTGRFLAMDVERIRIVVRSRSTVGAPITVRRVRTRLIPIVVRLCVTVRSRSTVAVRIGFTGVRVRVPITVR